MFEVREKPQLVEKALLVGVYYDKSEADEATSLLQELRELVETLNIGIARTTLVKVREGPVRRGNLAHMLGADRRRRRPAVRAEATL